MEQVTTVVTMNAGTVLDQYFETGLSIDTALTTPWKNAANAMKKYETDNLALMNSWTQAGATGYFYNFQQNATNQLKSPWSAGTSAANTFKTDISKAMDAVVKNVESNVAKAKSSLNSLHTQIQDTSQRASSVSSSASSSSSSSGSYTSGSSYNGNSAFITGEHVKTLQKILNQFFGAKLTVDGSYGSATTTAVEKAQNIIKNYLGSRGYRDLPQVNGKYDAKTKQTMQTYFNLQPVGSWFKDNKISIPPAMYAKGTLGTKKDEWAITDEIGDELVMYATPEGRLSYMRVGSTVVPHDLTKELINIGEVGLDGLRNMPQFNSGVSLMSNYINKPEINLTFDALVKAERIDENTLPEVKRFVQQEMNNLIKQMNYSIKGKGAR